MCNRINTLKRMQAAGISPKLASTGNLAQINDACDRLDKFDMNISAYANIQQAVVADPEVVDLIAEIDEPQNINSLLSHIIKHGDSLKNYTKERIACVASIENPSYLFLRNFDLGYYSYGICENLQKYSKDRLDFTEPEKTVLYEFSNLSTTIIPPDEFSHVCELFETNSELKALIYKLHELGYNDSVDYDKLLALPKTAYKSIFPLLDTAGTDFFRRWASCGYVVSDLKKLLTNKDMSIYYDRCSYTSFIYGKELSKLYLAEWQEDIIIYAIANKKNAFLKLVNDNLELFASIPRESLLHAKNIYEEHLNINELNSKNLTSLKTMFLKWMCFVPVRKYTFNEIQALYDADTEYAELYHMLGESNLDKRLSKFMQIKKRSLLEDVASANLQCLADRLNEKSLVAWMKDDFGHINDLQARDATNLLAKYDDVKDFIKEIRHAYEIPSLLRNGNMDVFDSEWDELSETLKLDDEFIKTNEETIKLFLHKNGAEIVNKYITCVDDKESVRRIVKAELAGKYIELRYANNCLHEEVNAFVNDSWKDNLTIKESGLVVRECDDFFSIINLGAKPVSTCLNYDGGQYVDCLLSCFDASKKVLYVENDGIVRGRAMMYITTIKKAGPTLSYIGETVPPNVIFAVVVDIMHCKKLQPADVAKALYAFAKEKARKLSAVVVFNNSYTEVLKDVLEHRKINMYVTASRSSGQYLSIMGGHVSKSEESGYKIISALVEKGGI
jgi:hypothetical protein